jgi:pimeloyl-ACP methyl ester carboxylesterase
MNPRAMGDFIIRIADHFGLENPHIVGPDIGTSSALFAAGAQPGRFRSLVVGSGGAAVPLQLTYRPFRHRYASWPGARTRWYHRSTPNTCTTVCPTAGSTSFPAQGTSAGKRSPTRTRRSYWIGGPTAVQQRDTYTAQPVCGRRGPKRQQWTPRTV